MSIACIAADNCWAVGIKGTVLHTTNGGSTWPLLAGITQATISKVRFVEANHGFMLVGATLYRTSDAGAHWFAAPLPGSANDFSFVDAQTGWACGTGGKIWKTADNGGTWTEQSSGTLGDLYGIAMASSSVGWVVGINGIVRATADGGGKWTSQTSGTQSSLRAVHAFDAQSALAVGDGGTILLASIGGSTWTPVASGTGQHLQAVAFSGSAGWAVGNTGVVLRSTDLGHTFQPTPSGTQAGLFGVAAPDASTMYAVGAGGTIIKTVNGGTAFTNFSSSVTTSTLNDIAWATGTTGVVVGDGGLILLTQDGGTTWGKVTSGFAVAFKAVAFPTPTVGFIAGAGGRVLRSSDAGASWAPLTTGVTADLEELRFLSDTLGFASGANGTLIKTADGGTTWTKLVTGMGGTLLGLWFTDEDHGWIGTDWGGMGGDAIVKRTIDGGQFWAYTANAPNYQHSDWGNADIWFRDNDEGWSVGRHCCSSNGIIRHLLKSGDQWNVQTSVAGGLYAIAFFNQGLGLVVGKDGIVVQSTDAGSSWAQLPALTSATLYGVAFKPAGEAWIVGQNGVILKAIAKP
jgi:photosystem II stability/assembly factor-like uncharacterized protein